MRAAIENRMRPHELVSAARIRALSRLAQASDIYPVLARSKMFLTDVANHFPPRAV